MKNIILFLIFIYPGVLSASSDFPKQLLSSYKPIKNLKWEIKFSKEPKVYKVWVAKNLQNKKKSTLQNNISIHTSQKSTYIADEVLVVSIDKKVDVYIDLNTTGLVRPVKRSLFKLIQNNKFPKTVKCENEALSLFTEAGIDVYFCRVQGKLTFAYDLEDIP